MKFSVFGNENDPAFLFMHGMGCDWRKFYEIVKPLEKKYRLIFPAMDGFYDGCPEYTSFADQCRQIEEYVKENFDGKLKAVYGISQGATLMSELLARNNIEVETAILDGVYTAHQGKWCVHMGMKGHNMLKKNNGKLPKWVLFFMKLMGLDESDAGMLTFMYLDASDKSRRDNLLENYTYHANPDIANNTSTKVHLWCGSKEPYALKSHKMLKKYLKNYEEKIFEGYGHGQLCCKYTDRFFEEIDRAVLGKGV